MYNNKLKIDNEYYTRLDDFFGGDGYLQYAEKAFKDNYWLFMNSVNIVKACSVGGMPWQMCVDLIIEDIVNNHIDEWGFPEICGLEEHALAAIGTHLHYVNK